MGPAWKARNKRTSEDLTVSFVQFLGQKTLPLTRSQQTMTHQPEFSLSLCSYRLPGELSWERIHLQHHRPQLASWVGKIPWRRDRLPTPVFLGFPGGSDYKGRPGYDPWVRKIPRRREQQPAPVFLPGDSPWTEEPRGLQSMGSQRARYD